MKKLILVAALVAVTSAYAQPRFPPLMESPKPTPSLNLGPKGKVLLKECETAHKMGGADNYSFTTQPKYVSAHSTSKHPDRSTFDRFDRSMWEGHTLNPWTSKYGYSDIAVTITYQSKNRFGEAISTSFNCGWSGQNYEMTMPYVRKTLQLLFPPNDIK